MAERVDCDMPEAQHPVDDLDPKAYALRVVVPVWMGSLEDRVRCALQRTGFQIDRLLPSDDCSIVSFWVRGGRPLAHLETLGAARAALKAALTNVECPCTRGELVLEFDEDCWYGAYATIPPEENINVMAYVDALPPYA